MRDYSDMELVREYARLNSEAAFAELVRRHIGLVYSAALRHAGQAAPAEEITQAVFIILARKAADLHPDTLLDGWLYQTTRLASLSHMRGEHRRQLREQEAYLQSTLRNSTDEATWRPLSPLLDEAMSRLGRRDRDAVILRFFKEHSVREVAAALQVNEAAAQRRLLRALQKLRAFLVKRGIDSTTAAIAGAISAHSVQAAPAGLAGPVTALAAARGAAAGGSTLTLIKGALKIMAWTKAKTAIVAGAAVLLAAGTTTLPVKTLQALPTVPTPDIQGSWEGEAEILGAPGMLLGERARSRVVFQFFKTHGAYTATGVFIDTAPEPFQVAKFTYDYPAVRFTAGQDSWEGKLQPGATEIAATQRRGDLSATVRLKRTVAPDAASKPLAKDEYAPRTGSDLQGTWAGSLGTQRPVRVVIKIAEPAPGTFRAELDNLNTSWLGQPVTVTYNPPGVTLQVASGAGAFHGGVRNGGTEMVGNWIQGGGQTPAILHRADR